MKKKLFIWTFFIGILLLFLCILIFGMTFGIFFIAGNFIAVAFLYYFYYFFQKGSKGWRIFQRATLIVYGLFLLSFAAVEILLIREPSIAPAYDAEYVIILGAGLNGEEISQTLESRLKAGVEYLQNHPEVPVIVSGGQGEGEFIPESTAMARYLLSHGISMERITEEDKSATTRENLELSKRILKNKGADEDRILIVTSDYHLFRAILIGEGLGMDCSGMAGDSAFFIKINYLIREYFAVVKTLLMQIANI